MKMSPKLKPELNEIRFSFFSAPIHGYALDS